MEKGKRNEQTFCRHIPRQIVEISSLHRCRPQFAWLSRQSDRQVVWWIPLYTRRCSRIVLSGWDTQISLHKSHVVEVATAFSLLQNKAFRMDINLQETSVNCFRWHQNSLKRSQLGQSNQSLRIPPLLPNLISGHVMTVSSILHTVPSSFVFTDPYFIPTCSTLTHDSLGAPTVFSCSFNDTQCTCSNTCRILFNSFIFLKFHIINVQKVFCYLPKISHCMN